MTPNIYKVLFWAIAIVCHILERSVVNKSVKFNSGDVCSDFYNAVLTSMR